MKKNLLFILTAFFTTVAQTQPGQYAGSKKALIGQTYTDSRAIPGLKGWRFREGSVVTPLSEPEMIIADVFQKGSTQIVFFSIMEDTASGICTIMDLAEVRNVMTGWGIKTGLCRQNGTDNAMIAALVKWSPSLEYLKPARKAWRFNRDKRRLEVITVKGIDCINEGLN
jgi:hypothetical protein